jgi:hypothetical protein
MTWKVWFIPVVIAALAFAGVIGSKKISLPTLTYVFDRNFKGESSTAGLTVEGVRCVGTADALRQHISGLPGLVGMVAYAGKHRVVVEYDPRRVTLGEITSTIDRPVMTRQGAIPFFRVVKSRSD